MPFDTTRVIGGDWSAHHQPVAAGGMNAHIQIRNPQAATYGFDEFTESRMMIPGPVIYDGPARVQQFMRAERREQADADVSQRTYLIQYDAAGAAAEPGWTITVTAAPNDAALVAFTTTRPMVIDDVMYGSERFTRDVRATLNASQGDPS